MEEFIRLDKNNIDKEHICCAFSDKKCKEGYELKKEWLKNQFTHGYVFRRLDARAKVFIEYGPVEKGWVPVDAENYLLLNCFWVSGKYKNSGYGKKLLQFALDDAEKQGKKGVVTVTGTKKFHFMSDTKWLLNQGFHITEKLSNGFCLLTKKIQENADDPKFKKTVLSGEIENKDGLTVFYSNRCPFSEYYVKKSLVETAEKRKIALKIVKLETLEQAQSAPSPATVFSLFYLGKFITTDISICMDSRFDKIMAKNK